MVIEEVGFFDEKGRSALAIDFAKHCTWYNLERGRIEKTQLAKPCSHRLIANQFPPGSTYYFLSTKAAPTAFYHLKSIAVASSPHRPCPSCQTSDTPRKLSG